MDFLGSNALFKSFKHHKRTLVVHIMKLNTKLICSHIGEFLHAHGIESEFDRANSFHHSLLERSSDSHYLACRFHLSSESTFCVNKFIERPFGEFYNNIIERRLEAGISFARDLIDYFIKSITDSDLCRRLGYRISRSL